MTETAVEASFEHLSITENIESLPEEEDSGDEEHHVSGLGSHEYWEAAYGQELLNLLVHGDEGEIWLVPCTPTRSDMTHFSLSVYFGQALQPYNQLHYLLMAQSAMITNRKNRNCKVELTQSA